MDIEEQDNTITVPVPDRMGLRREYLMQKARAYTGALMCTGMFVPAFLVTLGLAAAAVFVLIACLRDSPIGVVLAVVPFTFLLFWSAAAGLIAWSLWQETVRFIRIEAKQLPYAPPVNPDALPAEEILVRSSDEPPVIQSEVLVRAADSVDTPPEQLLRVIDQ